MNITNEKNRFSKLAEKANVPTKIAKIFIKDNISDKEAVEFLSKIRSVKEQGISESDKKLFLYGGIIGRKNKIMHLLEDDKYFFHIYHDLNSYDIWELIKYWCSK